MQDGKTVWLGSSGFADLEARKHVTDGTLYSLASTTKMFVSATVLRLWELGRLGLDDPIRDYVPAYMPSTDRVTIRNLLGHTSGYRDVEYDRVIIKWLADPNHIWRRAQILTRVEPVHFRPGSRFEYCNTNYVILGHIIERASGASIGETFDRLIVDALDLSNDAVFPRVPPAAPRIAHGYDSHKLHDTFERARLLGVPTGDWGVMWTDGGLAADARGVARFTDALFGGRVLRPETLQAMMAPGPDGSYGLGTYRMRFDGREWHGHDGFYYGFTTVAMYDFKRRVTIVVLTNLTDSGDPAFHIWYALTRAYDSLAS
jgi:D-alanyl-D-alanine carboxypeptidase